MKNKWPKWSTDINTNSRPLTMEMLRKAFNIMEKASKQSRPDYYIIRYKDLNSLKHRRKR